MVRSGGRSVPESTTRSYAESALRNDRTGLLLCWDLRPSLRTESGVARFGPTTPKRAAGSPLALWRLDRLSCCRTLLAAERLSPPPVNAYARCVRDRGPWDVPSANSWVG